MSTFFAEIKYQCVIEELLKRGYNQNVDNFNETKIIWTSLKTSPLDSVESDQFINHIQGSQHFSNKAYLAYHLTGNNTIRHCPLTWSPAFQSVGELIFMLLPFEIISDWKNFKEDFSRRISHVHFQLKILTIIEQSFDLDIPSVKDKIKIYKGLLNKFSSERSISDTDLETLKVSFCNNMVCQINIWILKPVALSCGEQIRLAIGIEEVLKAAIHFDFKCVIQKYIENPLLVRGNRKFDIRQWILMKSLDPLQLYGFSECYLRLTSKGFTLEEDHISDPLMHLCNHAIQKTAATESESLPSTSLKSSANPLFCDTMMTQDEFIEELSNRFPLLSSSTSSEQQENLFFQKILPKIQEISFDVIRSVEDRLVRFGEGFEWLGLDLMITEDLNVYLIEVNTSPDISFSTPVTTRVVKAAVKDLFDLLIPSSTTEEADKGEKEEIKDPKRIYQEKLLQWIPWQEHERVLSALQIASQKRSMSRFRLKCTPTDPQHIGEVMKLLQQHFHGNPQEEGGGHFKDENDDEDEL